MNQFATFVNGAGYTKDGWTGAVDLNAVFTVTLCELKLTDAPQKKFERLIITEQKAFVL